MDDEYSQKKGTMQNYYGIAHTFREPVEEQPNLMVNGRLKEDQVSRGEREREGKRVRRNVVKHVLCVHVCYVLCICIMMHTHVY